MAFSDGKFWQVDLTTRAGANTGAFQASIVCFLMAVLSLLGLVMLYRGWGPGAVSSAVLLFQAGQFMVFLVAGLLLRKGKGFYLGVAALVLLVFNLIANLLGMSVAGAIMDAVLALVLGNGLRGAKALMNNRGFEDDDIGTFS